jgi:integrase/recombinase XerD
MAIQVLHSTALSCIERLADDYLSHCAARGLAPRTVDRAYGYALHAIFLPWCRAQGIEDLSQLDRRAVDRFNTSLLTHVKVSGQPLSKYSVHTYIRPVRQMLTWAESLGEKVEAKPQLPRRSKPLRDVLSLEEIDMLEDSLPSERDKLIIRILADCGLRLEELTRLTADDIVRSSRQAHLRVFGKLSRFREVPIMPPLLRRLDRHVARRPAERSSDRILLSDRRGPQGEYEPLTVSGVYKVVKDAAARARMRKNVHPHLLRHSWMTEMLRRGMNPIQLSVIAGASPAVIAGSYEHLSKEDAYDAMLQAIPGRARR